MTVLYIIAILVMSFAVLWSGFITFKSIWDNKAANALGAFLACGFNVLILFLLIDGLRN